jgi:hypothetical protein
LKHFASPEFWVLYRALPQPLRELADRNFSLLKNDPRYSSLHLKKAGRFWFVRIGLHYRAVAVEVPDGLLWFWIGSHEDYNKLMG